MRLRNSALSSSTAAVRDLLADMSTRLMFVAMLLGLVATMIVTAPSAHALSGTGYDGTDPARTGCANSSSVIWSSGVYTFQGEYVGSMEVRYSSVCKTNWVRTNVKYAAGSSSKYIERPAQAGFARYATKWEFDAGAGWSYSMQVYAPGSTMIKAMASIDTGGCCSGSKSVTLK